LEKQIFISHTHKDKETRARFNNIAVGVKGINAFYSEFEDIGKPDWKTIKKL
jgi:hypothetical protein